MKRGRLAAMEKALLEARKRNRGRKKKFFIPALWEGGKKGRERISVDPFDYFLRAVRKAKAVRPSRKRSSTGGEWTRHAVVYNLLIRTTTAFDHNGNGELDLGTHEGEFRETGTFLKTIALLPYLKRLGINTIHLLPITAIGHDGNKGTLGSPYAIRDPYAIEPLLCEPVLGLDPVTEFGAFAEAAHNMGVRIVVEFVLRTAAKDSDWIPQHPEWFYWIREEVETGGRPSGMNGTYGPPRFSHEELRKIHEDVDHRRFGDLLPPNADYRDFFTLPPPPGSVEKVDGRYIGRLGNGQRVKIPGAFADWPPDDRQPPWDDVTYLRMYTNPGFNYIAYNTIRMYDSRLSTPEFQNEALWERIIGIVPFYQKEFSINGVMIDMGHALPMTLKKRLIAEARLHDPDFAFWDENFSVTSASREEGYNAVVGYLWLDEPHPERMRHFFARCSSEGFPLTFFATAETHNTPRAAARPGGMRFARWSAVVNAFLPGVLVVHSGFELGETYPINTGLDFTHDELRELPSDKLPLFSHYQFGWGNPNEMSRFLSTILRIRRRYQDVITNHDPSSFKTLHDANNAILSFGRLSGKTGRRLAVMTNSNFFHPEKAGTLIQTRKRALEDLLTGKRYRLSDSVLHVQLEPGQCLVFEY